MFRGFFFMLGLPLPLAQGALVLADYKEDYHVRCTSSIFMLIAYYLGFTNRKRKYFKEKMTATLKNKRTSIATVRNHLRLLASFLIPLIFIGHHLQRIAKSVLCVRTWWNTVILLNKAPRFIVFDCLMNKLCE
jgi:hypothetical protein